mmetsp:Transcript_6104/g.9465  ORF Transcript_6104/g.9465 Transcript_6104/m.9465 type:complete len:398 (-) Transcript_6104:63-1256(-)
MVSNRETVNKDVKEAVSQKRAAMASSPKSGLLQKQLEEREQLRVVRACEKLAYTISQINEANQLEVESRATFELAAQQKAAAEEQVQAEKKREERRRMEIQEANRQRQLHSQQRQCLPHLEQNQPYHQHQQQPLQQQSNEFLPGVACMPGAVDSEKKFHSKKDKKNSREKMRRVEINTKFEEIAALLHLSPHKRQKVDVLNEAIARIEELVALKAQIARFAQESDTASLQNIPTPAPATHLLDPQSPSMPSVSTLEISSPPTSDSWSSSSNNPMAVSPLRRSQTAEFQGPPFKIPKSELPNQGMQEPQYLSQYLPPLPLPLQNPSTLTELPPFSAQQSSDFLMPSAFESASSLQGVHDMFNDSEAFTLDFDSCTSTSCNEVPFDNLFSGCTEMLTAQ